jgi:hypothetical protein
MLYYTIIITRNGFKNAVKCSKMQKQPHKNFLPEQFFLNRLYINIIKFVQNLFEA